jgi:hypothetical protein
MNSLHIVTMAGIGTNLTSMALFFGKKVKSLVRSDKLIIGVKL